MKVILLYIFGGFSMLLGFTFFLLGVWDNDVRWVYTGLPLGFVGTLLVIAATMENLYS